MTPTPTNQRKAEGYIRVSGRSQADNFSLRSQDQDVRDYCAIEGIPFDRMWTDIGSGLSTKSRPDFLDMLEYCLDPANKVTDVVFWDLDRFTRNIEEFFTYTKGLINAGITLHIALDGEKYDYQSEEKWHQRLIAAQAESKRISRRVKRGQRQATMLGYHVGPAPWGYMLQHEPDEQKVPEELREVHRINAKGGQFQCGWLVPDPEKWDDVLKFWGQVTEGCTPMRVAIHMNLHNIPAPKGGQWGDDTVRRVIRNPKYYGKLVRGAKPQSRIPGPKENAPPTIVEDSHQAAVEYDEWLKANQAIDDRRPTESPARSHSSPNPLSNRIKCGECQSNGINSNLELAKINGVPYLRCSRRKKMGTDVCTFTSARLDILLERLNDRLRNHFLTLPNLKIITEGVAEASKSYLENQQSELAPINARKKVVQNEIDNINGTLKSAGPAANNFRSLLRDLNALETEIQELEQKAAQIADNTEEARLFINDKEGIIATALDRKIFTNPDNLDEVRDFMRIFIERVEVFPREGKTQRATIQYDLPVRLAPSEGDPTTETIYLGKKGGHLSTKSCGFQACTGRRPRAGWTDGWSRWAEAPHRIRGRTAPGGLAGRSERPAGRCPGSAPRRCIAARTTRRRCSAPPRSRRPCRPPESP